MFSRCSELCYENALLDPYLYIVNALSMATACTNVVVPFGPLKVGDCFDSFADVEHSINLIQDATAVQLYKRDSRTLVASADRYPGRAGKAKPELQYYCMEFHCIYGGRKHKSKSNGLRKIPKM